MERVMTPEERIRKAEEIYYRRRSQGIRVSSNSVNVGNKGKISLGRKMIIQIVICLVIYCSFTSIKKYDNMFSQNIVRTTKNFLEYDINLGKLYSQCVEYFNNNFNNIIKNNNQIENNIVEENKIEEIQSPEEVQVNDAVNENGVELVDQNTEENTNAEEMPGIGRRNR